MGALAVKIFRRMNSTDFDPFLLQQPRFNNGCYAVNKRRTGKLNKLPELKVSMTASEKATTMIERQPIAVRHGAARPGL